MSVLQDLRIRVACNGLSNSCHVDQDLLLSDVGELVELLLFQSHLGEERVLGGSVALKVSVELLWCHLEDPVNQT